jgi:hypothetical protein
MRNEFQRTIASGVLGTWLLGLLLLLLGCSTKPLKDPIFGPSYEVRNVYRQAPVLPVNVRRVAVLPLSYKDASAGLISGKESLEPVLHTELAKAARFELVMVEPTHLKQWTGRERWDAYEALPPRLFKELSERTGADAVLFSHLSEYKAYPPIVVGWRMKLVGNNAETIWAVEEMFDAAEEPVSNAARRYDRGQVRNSPVLEDSRSILLSPARFGQYTLRALLDTLPAR